MINRAYRLAGTSFGHLTTSDELPPGNGHPINGTIFDLLERNSLSWADYFEDVPQGASFRPFGSTLYRSALPATAAGQRLHSRALT